MNDIERVSIGFLFSEDKKRVALMTRDIPELNLTAVLTAIGGHIEDGESMLEAMRREFKEEAGLEISDWKHYASIYRKDAQIDFFKAFSDEAIKVETMEEDRVKIYYIERLRFYDLYPNLNYMLGLALDDEIQMVIINH